MAHYCTFVLCALLWQCCPGFRLNHMSSLFSSTGLIFCCQSMTSSSENAVALYILQYFTVTNNTELKKALERWIYYHILHVCCKTFSGCSTGSTSSAVALLMHISWSVSSASILNHTRTCVAINSNMFQPKLFAAINKINKWCQTQQFIAINKTIMTGINPWEEGRKQRATVSKNNPCWFYSRKIMETASSGQACYTYWPLVSWVFFHRIQKSWLKKVESTKGRLCDNTCGSGTPTLLRWWRRGRCHCGFRGIIILERIVFGNFRPVVYLELVTLRYAFLTKKSWTCNNSIQHPGPSQVRATRRKSPRSRVTHFRLLGASHQGAESFILGY